MDEQMQSGRICYCRDCRHLDYAQGKCSKCGSKNIVGAYQDFVIGFGRQINLTQSTYDQQYGAITNMIS